MAEKFGLDNDIRVSTLSKYPDVFTMEEQGIDEKSLWLGLEKAIRGAAEQFVESRIREGEHLKKDLCEKLAVTVATMLYALWIILGERPLEYIYALLMLGCGFGAGMILGFMATIYVSGERVYITLYFIMLFVTMFCIYRMADAVEEKIKQTGGKLAVTLLVLICLVNVGFVTLSC